MLRQRKESGLSVKAWCQEQGLAEHVYYYRLRKLRQAACTALEQVQPLQLAEVPLAPIRCSWCSVSAANGAWGMVSCIMELH